MQFPEFFPWQKEIAKAWLQDSDRFSHAWLIYGQRGIGKFEFAYAAAAAMLCENPQEGQACQKCQACLWIEQQSHPDLRIIVPDEVALDKALLTVDQIESNPKSPSKVIRVSQLRDLYKKQFFSLSSHRGGPRILIIYPAESMNEESANALLKILEEPIGNTRFLLVSHALRKLLPTILSRTRRLSLPVPDTQQALAWLQDQRVQEAANWLNNAAGAPLLALKLSESEYEPVKYWLEKFVQNLAQGQFPDLNHFVNLLEKIPAPQWILSLQQLVFDVQMVYFQQHARYFPMLNTAIQQLAQQSQTQKLAQTANWLLKEQATAAHPFNNKLFIQTVLQRVVLTFIKR
ncbi:DNA polymerase III subunit delta' [Brackiella oedipodis]|uniref:DNA polymerase III subunit delta' n=1 Tax=Brackiella oedipodis TaxID=124225 RepID=UPI00056F6B05|nr:DNA polymerase III subunit delta' [Brackiella oedipodis]